MTETQPKPPRHLSLQAKRFWRAVCSEYELECDALLILQTACEQWDRAQQARELLAREGLVVDGRRHAGVDIEKQATGLFLRAMRQLALDVVEPGGDVGRPAS
jgi:phage terminase small subunit